MREAVDMVTNTSVPAYTIDTSHEQAILATEIAQSAILVSFGHEVAANWDFLNASRVSYANNFWHLLEGIPGTSSRVTDVCLVKQVTDLSKNQLFI